jgi:hypothetical protein
VICSGVAGGGVVGVADTGTSSVAVVVGEDVSVAVGSDVGVVAISTVALGVALAGGDTGGLDVAVADTVAVAVRCKGGHPCNALSTPVSSSSMVTCPLALRSKTTHCSKENRPNAIFRPRTNSSTVTKRSPLQSPPQTSGGRGVGLPSGPNVHVTVIVLVGVRVRVTVGGTVAVMVRVRVDDGRGVGVGRSVLVAVTVGFGVAVDGTSTCQPRSRNSSKVSPTS